MTPLLLTAWTVAAAQSAPDKQTTPGDSEEEAPLALPIDQVHAPVPDDSVSETPEQPLAIPGRRAEPPRSAVRLQALRQYQQDRISLGTEFQFHSSGPPVSVGFGGPWHGIHWSMLVANPYVHTSRTHSMYQGTTRLDMPDFLGTVGARDLRGDLERDILRANRYTTLWNVVAGSGIAGIVVGYMGMSSARDSQTYYTYANVATGGLAMTIGGLIGSSATSSKSFRLRRYPAASIGVNEAEQLADSHNDRLRQELGLTPEDVWGVESQGR